MVVIVPRHDFTVVYKLSKTHVIAYALSRLLDVAKPTSVFDQTIDASLFYTELEWLNDVKEFLRITQIQGTFSIQQKYRSVSKDKPFTLKNDEYYRMGQNNRLRQCLTTTEA
jgi:hypothetical protein